MSELEKFFSLSIINEIVQSLLLRMNVEKDGFIFPNSPLMLAVVKNDADILKILIESGADVNERYTNGLSPLMLASALGRKNLIRILIDSGADVNAKSKTGCTALTYASFFSSSECVRILVDAGADLTGCQISNPDGVKKSFHDTLAFYIMEYSKQSGLKISEIYKSTKIYEGVYALSKQTFSKIRSNKNPNYRPKKKSVLVLALGMRLTLEQTEDLLSSAGYFFNENSRFDMLVKKSIEERNFDIGRIEENLYRETGKSFCRYP